MSGVRSRFGLRRISLIVVSKLTGVPASDPTLTQDDECATAFRVRGCPHRKLDNYPAWRWRLSCVPCPLDGRAFLSGGVLLVDHDALRIRPSSTSSICWRRSSPTSAQFT